MAARTRMVPVQSSAARQIWPRGIFAWDPSSSIILLRVEKERFVQQKGALITESTTIGILGGNSVAGRALEALLQGVGYKTRLIEYPPASEPDEFLAGVELLLVSPTLGDESREFLLADIEHSLDATAMPVLTLSTTPKGALGDQPVFIPWPCRIEDLTKKIEATLLPLPKVAEA